jgi:two-component system sensor histidine kinase PilS (NtrC family)
MPTDAIAVLEESPVRVCMDVDQLYQVVGNLCQNAFRHSGTFSGERSVVELRYGSDGGDPYLDVVDWGSGITPEVADNIFDPFFTTTPKGTGLGLYIARELCEGNGGRLDYYPGEGVGSRFRITFSKAEHCAEIT